MSFALGVLVGLALGIGGTILAGIVLVIIVNRALKQIDEGVYS